MVLSRDRVLNALDLREPIDRVPKMELFASILPFLKSLIKFNYFPNKIQNWLLKILENTITSTLRQLKMVKKASPSERRYPTDLISNIIGKRIAENASSIFGSDEKVIETANLYLSVPIKLGYDAWSLISLQWPNVVMGKVKENNSNLFNMALRDGGAYSIGTDLEILSKSIIFPNDYLKQIKFQTAFFRSLIENEELEVMTDRVKRILNSKIKGKKIKDQIVAYPMIPGIYETWLCTFGSFNMTQFHKVSFKEWRNGCKGPYHDLLKLKAKTLCRYVKLLEEIDEVLVFCLGDDSAIINGPMSNPKLFQDYIAPHTKKIIDQVHKSGLKFIFHSDGNFKLEGGTTEDEKWHFMNTIIDTGIDALHPIEMYGNDIGEIKEKFGDKICLCNGIDTMELQNGTRKSVGQCTYNILQKVYQSSNGQMNGYMAGSDNSIHSGVKINLWKQMLHTIDNFSKRL